MELKVCAIVDEIIIHMRVLFASMFMCEKIFAF